MRRATDHRAAHGADDAADHAAHLIDSRVLGDAFASPALRALFSDRSLVQAWLDVEAALAEAQADLGVVPEAAAAEIRSRASVELLDLGRLGAAVEATSHPLVPVIEALEALCAGDAGQYLHWGATTQDVTDTALVLLSRRALELVEERLRRVHDLLLGLAERHRDLVMAGRTHGQQALPITLGFKFAVLASEVGRHLDRIAELRPRVLVGQLGGAVGSLASLGERGLEVQRRLMERLGLGTPLIAWHTARDGFAEMIAVLSMVSATAGKIANEVRVLQRTEVAELEEPNAFGKIGSSTMPHKRNPMVAENVVAGARITRQATALALDAMVQEHERDMTTWGVEWATIPETFVLTAGALERCAWILEGLTVAEAAIARNLGLLGGLMLSEALMMRLAGRIGRLQAHERLYAACMEAHESRRPLREVIRGRPELMAAFVDEDELERLLEPARYVGLCGEFVDRVLAHERGRTSG